jgi:ribosome-binding protein aMBF1 (putative translation factor)
MRARRAKKVTAADLAKEIGEPEKAIKMAEQGVIPEGDYNLIMKLEAHLGIRILKPEVAEELERRKKQLGFDDFSSKNLTISDLQEMKKDEFEVQEEKKEPYWRRFVSKLIGKKKVEEEIVEEKVDFDEEKKVPIEFDNTSLEISEDLPEQPIEEEKDKKELSQEDIDDIIFGRK